MPRFDDYDDHEGGPSRSSVPFPGSVRAAGIIWICFGALGLVGSAISFISQAGQAANQGQGPQGNVCGLGCGVLFAVAFLVVGIQTVKGTAKGTLANGIGSLVFGLVYGGLSIFFLVLSSRAPMGLGPMFIVVAGILGVQGLVLLIAGILAIAGRERYADWREAQGMDRKPRRRMAEEDDYDDRPRRRERDRYDDDRE